jgi:hypothetical protein
MQAIKKQVQKKITAINLLGISEKNKIKKQYKNSYNMPMRKGLASPFTKLSPQCTPTSFNFQ